MRATIRPEWTFEELVENACQIYQGHGVESAGRRNRLFRQWADLVGSERALAELDRYVRAVGGIEVASEAMRIQSSTLKRLRKDFGSASAAPVVATRGPRLRPGEVLSGSQTTYTVSAEIGKGGMGRVYTGERPDGTRVALKLLSSDRFAVGASERARFVREARLARGLDHPNLVRAFELVEHRGLLVTVMELLPGDNLHDRLARARPNRATALRWMNELARGLAALHEAKIVHRDISARNALIRSDGTLAISDFGVARRIDDPTLTKGSESFGSLIYISPQQRDDPHATDFADDVFSLGQLFFYIATGTNPHNAGGLGEHEHELDAVCVTLIDAMRHHDRTRRPANAAEVLRRLTAATDPAKSQEK